MKRNKVQLKKEAFEINYATIFEAANDAIFIHEIKTGAIIDVNQKMCEMYGYTKDEAKKLDIKQLSSGIPPYTNQNALMFINKTINEGPQLFEWQAKDKNGKLFWVEVNLKQISLDACGRILAIVRDISQRKESERKLKESQENLEKALFELKSTEQQVIKHERLLALGKMASGIAHDFNNALAPILGFSELLLSGQKYLNNKEKLIYHLKMINTAAKDAASVVRRLREFYRYRDENEVSHPIDLNKLIEQAIILSQVKWKDQAFAENVTICIEKDLNKIPLISGNDTEIREALMNLIFNAVDAIEKSGKIIFRTYLDNKSVTVEVSDTGTGIPPDVLNHCLEPFYSTKGEKGTGLGLSMVYGIVKRHNGVIDIKSKVGEGTTFVLKFPANYPKAETIKETEEELPKLPKLHVLIVDDEPVVAQVIAEYIKIDGHSSDIAANGCEGLKKFLANKYDLIITDKGMPEMSGDEMALAIKKIVPEKPIILLTGYADTFEEEEKKSIQVDLIVSKPVTIHSLRKAISEVLQSKKRFQI